MYTDFTVRNFRLFEDLSVQFYPVTIISGKNNTGKTALLEALFLHASGPRAGSTALATLMPGRNSTIIMPQAEGRTIWDSLFPDSGTVNPISLAGTFNGSTVRLELAVSEVLDPSTTILPSGGPRVATGESRTQSLLIVSDAGGELKEYMQSVTQRIVNQQPSGPFNLQFEGINLRLDPPAEPFVMANIITARTRSNQAEIAQRYSDLRVLGRQRDLLNAIREIDQRLSGIEVLVTEGQPALHLILAGYSRPQPLSLFGEGIVAAIDILSIIYAKNSRVVLIDEIENGIHYTVLRSLWRHIKRAARATNTQVIATTHSRECIEAAQGAFEQDGATTLRLLRLWRKSTQAVSVTAYNFSEIGDALNLGLDVR